MWHGGWCVTKIHPANPKLNKWDEKIERPYLVGGGDVEVALEEPVGPKQGGGGGQGREEGVARGDGLEDLAWSIF